MQSLPKMHEVDYEPHELVGMKDIMVMAEGRISYPALRNYATHRRVHPRLGDMPMPVAIAGNRRVWVEREVLRWLDGFEQPFRPHRYSP